MHEHTLLNTDAIINVTAGDAVEIGINGITMILPICCSDGRHPLHDLYQPPLNL